jgi:ATP-dependent protease ClpP protease subunit
MAEETEKKEEKKPEPKANGEEKEELTPLQKLLKKSDVLMMLYPKDENGYFSENIQAKDEIIIYKLLHDKKDIKDSLIIFLDTGGGNVYSAVKIMDTLRTKYKDITIGIAQEAKSSGTMMCCGADKLIMSSISELGPLDKPMMHPDKETARISALDIVKSIDDMLDAAKDREKTLAQEFNTEFGIPIQKSLALASDSISKLISPMLCREDVKIYNQAKRLLTIAQKYGTEFLNGHMLKYINGEKLRGKIADMVVRRLVWLYPDHGFAIRRDELREWFFMIDDTEKVEYWDELWKEFDQNVGTNGKKITKFLNL